MLGSRPLVGAAVAGLLLVPTVDPSATLELIAASGTPAVLIDRPSGDGRFDEVTFDNHRIMTEAVSQLIGLGHYRILFIVEARKLSISRQRIAALHERAAAAVPQVDVFVMEVGDDPAAYAQRLTQMLEEPRDPIAVIVSNSVVASRTLRVLQTMGKDYPGRISLLAFEEPDWAELTSPQLSVIRQPVHGIAREAWELLLRRMHGEHSPVQHLELRAEITLRGSVRKVTRKPSR